MNALYEDRQISFHDLAAAITECSAAKIVPDNKSGTPVKTLRVPPVTELRLHDDAWRNESRGKNANHTHDVVSNVVNVSTFLILHSAGLIISSRKP